MKILTLHTDYIKFKPLKKALKSIKELKDKAEKEVKEALVVLTAVEEGDIDASGLVINIKDIAKQVKAKNIVLYPYAHLSSNLASPDLAEKILVEAEKALKKTYKVIRAPFGYYKEFELKVKGHPLSELSRTILTQETGKSRKVKEEKADYKNLLRQIGKSKLDREKLKPNDHRILGKQMDLFSFNETVAPGMVFWHDRGLIIKNKLIDYWREEHKKAGYEEVSTPQVLDKRLWQISGHWEKYENQFITRYEKRDFLVKPMNCPGGMLLYKEKLKSYKDFPLRVGELGIVHRQELSGVLAGLFRLVQFTQDDAHIFCADEKQVEQEITNLIDLINKFYKTFNLNFDHVELSTKPRKRIGSDKVWDIAEKILEKVLKKQGMKYKINKGEGAFYGPKIDFHIKDSQNRSWQLSTIQLDFAMPERFDLTYTDEKNKLIRPIMIHRVIYGAVERFIGILLEHLNGNLPAWLNPVQVKILPMTDRNNKAAEKIKQELEDNNIRVELDDRNESMSRKIRDAQLEKVNYMLTIGDKEEQAGTLAVRTRNGEVKFGVKLDDFILQLKQEIAEKK